MADFALAYKRTAQHEGGYSNDPNDRGKMTYAGVARKYHPNWAGWPIVDAVKNKRRGMFINDPHLKQLVLDFYKTEFWDKMQGDQIHSQRVAEFIYDLHVNSGKKGLMIAQEAAEVPADGKYGPKTLAALNGAQEAVLMLKLMYARLLFICQIVVGDKSQVKFLGGWLNRINSFKAA
jgi:lysozyme family protein